MKMQKYYDRDHFTYEEKATICKKSNDQCCHCGKKVFIGYGATIDHFIPLNRGGSNNHVNLIMLCHECNQEKSDKIFDVDYLPYLQQPYKEKLDQYVKSYVRVMDITHRNRLLAYNEYTEEVCAKVFDHKGHNKSIPATKYKIKLASWDDLDRLTDYLIKYLKKNDELDSEQSARENIIFWLHFGAIYYVERNNEINIMAAITVKNITEEEGFRGNTHIPTMYLFSYYNNEYAYMLSKNIVTAIPQLIIQEANIDYIPFSIIMLNTDKMLSKLSRLFNNCQEDIINGFSYIQFIIGGEVVDTEDFDNPSIINESDKKTIAFLSKFDDIATNIVKFYEKYEDRSSISWMISSIYSMEKVKDTKLMKYFSNLKNIT